MKVFDLQCAHQHTFEGWFASEDDYLGQLGRGLVSCPLCGDQQIQKMLSAPRLNLRAGHQPEPSCAGAEPAAPPGQPVPNPALQARFLAAMRSVMANTEDVGERFAEQARAMHHGEADPRNIRGHTTPDEAMALLEEGIPVLPLPQLPALKETLQ